MGDRSQDSVNDAQHGIEVHKCLNGLSPDIMNAVVITSKHGLNTRHYNLSVTDRSKADWYGQIQFHIGNVEASRYRTYCPVK